MNLGTSCVGGERLERATHQIPLLPLSNLTQLSDPVRLADYLKRGLETNQPTKRDKRRARGCKLRCHSASCMPHAAPRSRTTGNGNNFKLPSWGCIGGTHINPNCCCRCTRPKMASGCCIAASRKHTCLHHRSPS